MKKYFKNQTLKMLNINLQDRVQRQKIMMEMSRAPSFLTDKRIRKAVGETLVNKVKEVKFKKTITKLFEDNLL